MISVVSLSFHRLSFVTLDSVVKPECDILFTALYMEGLNTHFCDTSNPYIATL